MRRSKNTTSIGSMLPGSVLNFGFFHFWGVNDRVICAQQKAAKTIAASPCSARHVVSPPCYCFALFSSCFASLTSRHNPTNHNLAVIVWSPKLKFFKLTKKIQFLAKIVLDQSNNCQAKVTRESTTCLHQI